MGVLFILQVGNNAEEMNVVSKYGEKSTANTLSMIGSHGLHNIFY